MLEIIKYILGGFFKFIGFLLMLDVLLFYIVNGIVRVKKEKTKRAKVLKDLPKSKIKAIADYEEKSK